MMTHEEINGMTPEQIKDHLHAFVENWYNPSFEVWKNGRRALVAVLTYVMQLEEQICLMKVQMHGDCGVCKHRSEQEAVFRKAAKKGEFAFTQRCEDCIKNGKSAWEYEGLPEVESR